MATVYYIRGGRIAKDGSVSITWQDACGVDITGYDKSDYAVIAFVTATEDHSGGSETLRLQWRDVTDSGSFADVISGSGEVRAAASAGYLNNGDACGTLSGCNSDSLAGSEEVENESPMEATINHSKFNDWELQFCVDMSNCEDGHEYEFQLYSQTGSAAVGVNPATITIDISQTEDTISRAGYINIEKVVTQSRAGYINVEKIATVYRSGYVNIEKIDTLSRAGYIQIEKQVTESRDGYVQIEQQTKTSRRS